VGAASRSPHTPMQAAAAAAAPQHWAGPKATPSSSREPPRSLLCCLSVACDAMRCTWRATAARQRAAASRQRPKAPSRASAHPAARASAHRSFTWKRRRKRALRGEWWRASAAPRGAFFWMHARGTEADDPNDMHDDRDAVRCLASLSPLCDRPTVPLSHERASLPQCVCTGGWGAAEGGACTGAGEHTAAPAARSCFGEPRIIRARGQHPRDVSRRRVAATLAAHAGGSQGGGGQQQQRRRRRSGGGQWRGGSTQEQTSGGGGDGAREREGERERVHAR
jgi:hypothetical protein